MAVTKRSATQLQINTTKFSKIVEKCFIVTVRAKHVRCGFESRRPHFILQTGLEGRVYPRSNPLIVEGQEHSLKSHGSLHLPVSATFGALWGPLHPDSYWVSDGAVS